MTVAFAPVPSRYANLNPSQWWYVYKTQTGSYGLARSTHLPSNATQSVFVGVGAQLTDLATHFAVSISNSLKSIGAPAKTQAALIGQLDTGAILHNPNYVQETPKPTGKDTAQSNVPTTIGSSAVPTNIIPSPIDPNVGNSNLAASLGGISNFFGMLTSVAFWKGIGLVLAGAAILVFAALELKGGM